MDVRVGLLRKLSAKELMLLNCGVGEDSWGSLGLQGDLTSSPISKEIYSSWIWKDCYWSWNSNILPTWCKELTHWRRPWSWEWLKAGGEGDNRGWDGWMASPIWWMFVQTPGVGDRQGSLAYCSPWGCKESDTTEWLNWTESRIWMQAVSLGSNSRKKINGIANCDRDGGNHITRMLKGRISQWTAGIYWKL